MLFTRLMSGIWSKVATCATPTNEEGMGGYTNEEGMGGTQFKVEGLYLALKKLPCYV